VLGDRAPSEVVHYCGSGVAACHNLLAMEIAGLTGGRLYAGSWSEWIADPNRPIAR
jgi:thiosulfate/3-mercaptopyruvate sulfurtransferase